MPRLKELEQLRNQVSRLTAERDFLRWEREQLRKEVDTWQELLRGAEQALVGQIVAANRPQ